MQTFSDFKFLTNQTESRHHSLPRCLLEKQKTGSGPPEVMSSHPGGQTKRPQIRLRTRPGARKRAGAGRRSEFDSGRRRRLRSSASKGLSRDQSDVLRCRKRTKGRKLPAEAEDTSGASSIESRDFLRRCKIPNCSFLSVFAYPEHLWFPVCFHGGNFRHCYGDDRSHDNHSDRNHDDRFDSSYEFLYDRNHDYPSERSFRFAVTIFSGNPQRGSAKPEVEEIRRRCAHALPP